MADNNNTIKTTVELDVNQAQQDIVKLNSKASDSTKTLEERIEAKNKAVKLQNELSKKTIKSLEDEQNKLIKTSGSLKDIEKVSKKLNSERLKSVKLTESGSKQQSKLNDALEDSKSATKNLDNATGGLLGKMKAFVTNPIGLVVIALAGAFKLIANAIGRSEKASAAFSKIGAKLSGIMNGLTAILEPLAEFLGNTLLSAIEDPKQAFIDLANTIKNNVINRFKALLVLGEAVGELFKGNFSEATKLAADGFIQLSTGITNATEKLTEFSEVAKKKYDEAAKASENLANSERRLVQNRIALEKQQLTSLRLAEEERQIRDDTSKSIDERIEANKRLGKILDEQSKRELAIAQLNLNIALQKQKANGNDIESLEAVGDAEIKILEIRERISGQKSEQLVNETGLILEQNQIRFDSQAKFDQLELDALRMKGENTLIAELEFLEKSRVQELEALNLTQLQKDEINLRFKNQKDELELAEKEKKDEEKILKDETLLELEELEIERLKEKGVATLERELAFLETRRAQDVLQANLTAEQITLINKRAEAAKDKLRTISEKATKDKVDTEAQIGANAAAEAFGVSQELAVAQMLMKAPEAVGSSFTKAAEVYPAPLSLAMGALGAAGVVIPIIKGLSDIKKARFGGKGGGGGGNISPVTSSGGSSSSITPEVINNLSSNNSARLGLDTGIGSNASADASNNILGSSSSNIIFSESKYGDFKDQVKFKENKSTI